MTTLTILGTGNAQATRVYNTCLAISNERGTLLVDGGGGNGILPILEKKNISISSIHDLFVTHAHTDHLFGVIWMIRRIGETILKGEMEEGLTIYCHRELGEFIKEVCLFMLTKKVTSLFGSKIRFLYHEDGDEREIIGNRFKVFDTGSEKMKQFGFRMEYEEKVFVDAGDEPLLEKNWRYGDDADWLTHEAFCLYEDRERFKPYEKSHSTAKDAAETAERLRVKNLILYHTEDKTIESRKKRYSEEARKYYSGNVFVPDDGEKFII